MSDYRCVKGHDKCGEMYPGPECPYCEKVCERCGGTGWLPPLGPYRDGSYITSSPCPCSNVYAAHGLD